MVALTCVLSLSGELDEGEGSEKPLGRRIAENREGDAMEYPVFHVSEGLGIPD